MVCYIPQPSQDKKQTDVAWCQLAFNPKHFHALRGRDMKVHAVAYFEFKWSVSLVGIAFLVRSDSLQIGMDVVPMMRSRPKIVLSPSSTQFTSVWQ
jgi:hypothetical protein